MFSKYLLRNVHIILKTINLRKRNYAPAATYNRVTDDTIKTLKGLIGEKQVSAEQAVREQHGHDESYHSPADPDVVVFPDSVEQVSQVVKFCNDNRIPVIPFGTGTGLEGGVQAVFGGVCIDMRNMDKVVEANDLDFDITVQPGVTRTALNSYCRDMGMFFPIDPGAECSVCGMCATSASGTNTVRYGTMRENVLNLEVVLPNGQIIHTAGKGRRAKKTSAGYNLTNLFVGSEGTLGIITQATVRMYGIPEMALTAICHFRSIETAVKTVLEVVSGGIPVTRCEYLDEIAMTSFNSYSEVRYPVAHTLFVEFIGTVNSVRVMYKEFRLLAALNKGFRIDGTEGISRDRLWKARHEMLHTVNSLVPGSRPLITDVCVPVTRLAEIIVKTRKLIDEENLIGPILGHVGDGNFHVFFPLVPRDYDTLRRVSAVARKIALMSLEMNGTCSGEHGIGQGKKDFLVKEVGEEGVEAMKQIKKTFDPNDIMNPGKIFFRDPVAA